MDIYDLVKIMDDKKNKSGNFELDTEEKIHAEVQKMVEKNADSSDDELDDVNPDLVALVNYFQEIAEFESRDVVSPIHVDEFASRFAILYEKVRRVIDWKDENLVRRTAIERALKRRMISKLADIGLLADITADKVASPLVYELVRSGHFKNDGISKARIGVVQEALNKYIYLLSDGMSASGLGLLDVKDRVQFYNWILEIAACEIEEILAPPLKETALMTFMTDTINSKLRIHPADEITPEDQWLQTYIAVHRSLYNLDDPIVSYNILKHRFPKWLTNEQSDIEELSLSVEDIWNQIEEDLTYPKASEFYRVCEAQDAVFLILGDVLEKLMRKPDKMPGYFKNWENLSKVIKGVYNERVSTLKSRLRRSAVYSTLSMFLAGGVSLFLFEVPLAKLVYGEFQPLAVLVDLAIPAALMGFLVLLISPAGKGNYNALLKAFKRMMYPLEKPTHYEINLVKRRQWLKNLVFVFFYLLTTVVSFGFVYWIFYIADVPWTSLYIDTANVALVVFAALVIKQKSKEVTMEENAGLADFLIDLFSIPLARLGQWLASKWKEYNFVSVFFTAIVDVPIVTIVEVIEDWRSFLKEKKSGIH